MKIKIWKNRRRGFRLVKYSAQGVYTEQLEQSDLDVGKIVFMVLVLLLRCNTLCLKPIHNQNVIANNDYMIGIENHSVEESYSRIN